MHSNRVENRRARSCILRSQSPDQHSHLIRHNLWTLPLQTLSVLTRRCHINSRQRSVAIHPMYVSSESRDAYAHCGSQVRALATPNDNLILSASRDATAVSWSRLTPDSQFKQTATLRPGLHYVNALTYIPASPDAPEGESSLQHWRGGCQELFARIRGYWRAGWDHLHILTIVKPRRLQLPIDRTHQ